MAKYVPLTNPNDYLKSFNDLTNQTSTRYASRPFRDADGEGPQVIIVSDLRDNYRTDPDPTTGWDRRHLESRLGSIVERELPMRGDRKSLDNVVVIIHKPENVNGNSPEKYERQFFVFDQSTLRPDARKMPQELSPSDVASLIGRENFVERFERAPPDPNRVAPQKSTSQDPTSPGAPAEAPKRESNFALPSEKMQAGFEKIPWAVQDKGHGQDID